MALQMQTAISHLEVISGRISIFSILMSSSPGKEKYCFSCREQSVGKGGGGEVGTDCGRRAQAGQISSFSQWDPDMSSVPRCDNVVSLPILGDPQSCWGEEIPPYGEIHPGAEEGC